MNGKLASAELIDISNHHRADDLRRQAERCRRLTSSVLDPRTFEALTAMASEYEAEAERLARAN